MKLVQKILSHGLFIAVIVVAFLVYTKRAELFPQWFGASHATAARSTGDKVASAGADVGTLPPARTVTRPMPEKTLIKKEVSPAVTAPEKAGPRETFPGKEPTAPGQQQPAGSDSAAPVPSEPAEQPAADTAPAGADAASGAAGSETASEQTASDDTSAAPVFRPLDEAQPAPEHAAPTDAPASAAPVFRPLDDAQPAQKPGASADVSAPAETAAQKSEPVAAEPQQQAAQEPAAQQEQAARTQSAQEEPTAQQQQAAKAQAATAAMPRTRAEPATESPAASEPEPQMNAEDARLQQQLGQARELYWSRDLRGAAAAYHSLGEAYPDNAEVWGEIGNFYYSLRRSGQAGAAYSHAIELLMQNNDPVRARQLLAVLFRLDARKARELESRLQQAGG